jgi:hypothetical protein
MHAARWHGAVVVSSIRAAAPFSIGTKSMQDVVGGEVSCIPRGVVHAVSSRGQSEYQTQLPELYNARERFREDYPSRARRLPSMSEVS